MKISYILSFFILCLSYLNPAYSSPCSNFFEEKILEHLQFTSEQKNKITNMTPKQLDTISNQFEQLLIQNKKNQNNLIFENIFKKLNFTVEQKNRIQNFTSRQLEVLGKIFSYISIVKQEKDILDEERKIRINDFIIDQNKKDLSEINQAETNQQIIIFYDILKEFFEYEQQFISQKIYEDLVERLDFIIKQMKNMDNLNQKQLNDLLKEKQFIEKKVTRTDFTPTPEQKEKIIKKFKKISYLRENILKKQT